MVIFHSYVSLPEGIGKWDFTSNYGNIPWDYHFYTMGIYHGIIYISYINQYGNDEC